MTTMKTPPVVSPQEWHAARNELLVKEKALTRARDALAAERRRMPWLAVEKTYKFDGPRGRQSLLELFDGRRQLIVYRAFFELGVFGWPEHACRGCSMVADQVAHVAHLNARDTNVFFRDGERVFRTYFIDNRGDEQMGGTWNYLDITPLGRQEEWEVSPEGYPQTPPYTWWNWHDNYGADAASDKRWAEVAEAAQATLS